MTSTAKLQKDKFYGSTSRLTPRPTAASAARAARNAPTRSQTFPSAQKSPSRSTCPPKAKSGSQRTSQKFESTTNIKNAKRCSETDIPSVENVEENEECNVITNQEIEEPEVSVPDNRSEVATEDQSIINSADSTGTQETQDLSMKVPDNDGNKIENETEIIQLPEIDTKKTEASSTISSRPQTPKNLQSSRPQTPRKPSRPVTPANQLQRNITTTSRPNTPHRSSLPRLKTPSALKSATGPMPAINSQTLNSEHDNILTVYTTKQKTFHRMKKELDLKQQTILEMFNDLQNLRDHMVKEGISDESERLKPKELVIINVADWAAEEIAQLCHSSNNNVQVAEEIINTVMAIDENILAELETKVSNLPESFGDLCLQAFTARQELIDWVQKIIANQDVIKEEDVGRITLYNRQAFEHCDLLRDLKNQADECLNGVTAILKQAWLERGQLLNVGESLVKELAQLRQDFELHTAATKELTSINTAESDAIKALEVSRRELEEERANKTNIKEKLTNTEAQLRQARTRISKMDRQLREAEASISSLTGTVKSLEDQSRQKEVQLEARARKLKESLKTGEVTSNQLMQQRDSLQNELSQLKEQLEKNTHENKLTIQELNKQIKELKSALEEERNKTHEEMELKNMFEDSYRESLNTNEELKSQIAELENNKPDPDLPTEREMELRAEILAAKDTLRITEEEVIACKREKVRFLETLTKIAESENKPGIQPKLIAELQSKEEIISKMQTQIRELTKSIKFNEQKVIQYEQYVRDLQAYNKDSSNCEESNGVTYQDLQQEIMHLRMGLLETVHRNEELSEMLIQKEQQLEQQDKTSRAQARVIKIREDLVNMLKNKEMEQSRELSTLQQDLEHRMKIVDDVNKQIAAKAEEIQELFSTLENKQQQIHRLEKIVLALEEQQRRAQAQRTRHEEKIAALEHELSASGKGRERKFLFF